MAKNYVVTVGRQVGSMGRAIGKRTAELLGIEGTAQAFAALIRRRFDEPAS